jgi:SAM-dependent methyltransferase
MRRGRIAAVADRKSGGPETTHAVFDHVRVAEGYATARPYLHPEAFARVASLLGQTSPFTRALDVGCGTGLSTVALLALAREAVGVDASTAMLRHAQRTEGVTYAASAAEALPFAAAAFDLVIACGSLDWVDRGRFMPEAARLLRPGGFLVPLDFGDRGRSDEAPALDRWYRDVFLAEFPVPPARDPIVGADEARHYGFTPPRREDFDLAWPFTAAQYARFLMTESSIAAAVEYGDRRAEDVAGWLERQLLPVLGGLPRRLAFGGYVQLLRRA